MSFHGKPWKELKLNAKGTLYCGVRSDGVTIEKPAKAFENCVIGHRVANYGRGEAFRMCSDPDLWDSDEDDLTATEEEQLPIPDDATEIRDRHNQGQELAARIVAENLAKAATGVRIGYNVNAKIQSLLDLAGELSVVSVQDVNVTDVARLNDTVEILQAQITLLNSELTAFRARRSANYIPLCIHLWDQKTGRCSLCNEYIDD